MVQVTREFVHHCLPVRKRDGHKGTFGKVLFVAGSKGMCGAAYLCAAAALYAGTGMVKIQTEEEHCDEICISDP